MRHLDKYCDRMHNLHVGQNWFDVQNDRKASIKDPIVIYYVCLIQGGKALGTEFAIDNRNKMIELLRNELPVLRAKARVSQEEIAEIIGISRQTYSSIETGKREMSWTTFLALFAYFQNNANTNNMLNGIDGLVEGVITILEPSNDINENNKQEVG